MPNTSTPFFAARLWDEDHKFGLSYHPVDISSRESVLAAVEEIRKESHTPEQFAGIFGAILAAADELLTDEDRNTVFQGVTKAESTEPYVIPVTGETRGLIYSALGEIVGTGGEQADDPAGLLEELARLQDIGEAVVAYQNFDLADEDTEWDEAKAREQIKALATGESGKVDWSVYRKAFLYYDSEHPEKESSYKLPIAYSDGGFKAVPKAISSAAGYLGKLKASAEDKAAIKGALRKYYKKMGTDAPESISGEGFDQEAVATEVERQLDEAIEQRTSELRGELEAKRTELARLEDALVRMSTEKHSLKAREAAHLALKSGYPKAKGRSFDELVTDLSKRSLDSLNDLIEDLLPYGDSAAGTVDAMHVEHVESPLGTAESALVQQPAAGAPVASGETTLQTQMYNSVTQEDEDAKFVVLNWSAKDREDLRTRLAHMNAGVLAR